MFIVRDDSSHSDMFFQTSDTTWQAYNTYGGNSLYVGGPGQNPGRAYKVSYNRPFITRDGGTQHDWVFNAEYPMVRFLEANGYNVSYTTGVDSDRRGTLIQQHKVFLSVGHDEYWSGTQRTNVEAARNAGVNMAFFSGNEVFWKTRWESAISADGTQYRTLVSYKETHENAKVDPAGPTVWTGTWMDPRFSPPADGGRPQNALTGTLFTVNCCTDTITVPAADGQMRLWRNTAVASQPVGGVYITTPGTLGYEWDSDIDNGFRPTGLFRMSDTILTESQSTPRLRLDLWGQACGTRADDVPASERRADLWRRHRPVVVGPRQQSRSGQRRGRQFHAAGDDQPVCRHGHAAPHRPSGSLYRDAICRHASASLSDHFASERERRARESNHYRHRHRQRFRRWSGGGSRHLPRRGQHLASDDWARELDLQLVNGRGSNGDRIEPCCRRQRQHRASDHRIYLHRRRRRIDVSMLDLDANTRAGRCAASRFGSDRTGYELQSRCQRLHHRDSILSERPGRRTAHRQLVDQRRSEIGDRELRQRECVRLAAGKS